MSSGILNKETPALTDDGKLLRSVYGKYFISSMIAILFNSLGQIVNNIVVGNTLGPDKLAVMSLILPIFYVFATIGNMAGIGGSTVCASLIGERKTEECKKAFTVTYILTILMSVILTIIFIIFLPSIARLLGARGNILDDVMDYGIVMICGGVFTAGIYLSFNFLRLDGRSVSTIVIFIIMAVVNIAFDVILTVPIKLGMTGVSIATSLGAAAASIFGVVILSIKSDLLKFTKISISDFRDYSAKIFKVGSPGATENVSILLRSYLLNNLIVSIIAANALSSLSVVNSVNSFALSIIAGGAGALVPLVGVFNSERDTLSIRRIVKSSFIICGIILAVFILVIAIFAPQITNIFGITDVEFQKSTTNAIRLFLISLPFSLVGNIMTYLHLADSHTAISNIMTVLRNFVLIIAFAYLFMTLWGENGLWLSFVASEVCTLIITAILHLIAKKRNPSLSFLLLTDEIVEQEGASISVSVKNTKEDIMQCVGLLEEFCETNELSPKRTMLITLSTEELLLSVNEHSLKGTQYDSVSVRVLIYKDLLVLRFRHGGNMFNPIAYYESKKTDATSLDAMLELNDSLGIKMIVDACDVVDYRTTFGINNLTVII